MKQPNPQYLTKTKFRNKIAKKEIIDNLVCYMEISPEELNQEIPDIEEFPRRKKTDGTLKKVHEYMRNWKSNDGSSYLIELLEVDENRNNRTHLKSPGLYAIIKGYGIDRVIMQKDKEKLQSKYTPPEEV